MALGRAPLGQKVHSSFKAVPYDNDADYQTSMTDPTGTTTYALDELYRPTSITQPGNRVVGYLYDAAGNRTRVTYPDSKQVNYTYDDANRMDTVTDWASNTTDYGYDDAGSGDDSL